MTPEQEWCLACGAAVGTKVVRARGWRMPLVLAGTLALVGAIALAIAIIQLADDSYEVADPQPTPTAPTPTPAPTDPNATPTPAAPTPAPTETPTEPPPTEEEPTPSPTPAAQEFGEWPAGEGGWTVVVASKKTREAAERSAQSLADDGVAEIGLLNSDDYSSLEPGFWVVYSGRYDNEADAEEALGGIDDGAAYVREIVPN